MKRNVEKKPVSGQVQGSPRHVAIIMDGNGRWAKARKRPRLFGHRAGAESLRAVLRACRDHGVEILTVYAFSTENWVRPEQEVSGLMTLLKTFLKKDEHDLHENEVRLRVTGRMHDLPQSVQDELNRVMVATKSYTRGQLVLALSYGGRAELVDAVRAIAGKIKRGKLAPRDIDEKMIAEHLYLPDIPDPELIIRTSGEIRLSNFLLWESSYSELYFTPVLWPDFREAEFAKALAEFARRQRRFGAPS